MALNRRQFLLAAGGAALAAGSCPARVTERRAVSKGIWIDRAERLTSLVYSTFWDPRGRMFRAPVRSAETVDSDPRHNNGYTIWPSLIALHVLIDGERLRPGRYRDRIAEVYRGIEQYYDPRTHAYNAWVNFPGNNDKYYDDNGWAVIALAEAAEVTGNRAYRERACQILEGFLYGGWGGNGTPGGETWGTDPTKSGTGDKTACATSSAALGTLMLARAGVQRDRNIAWARAALDWITGKLQDGDGLIRDGFHSPDWAVMPTKWTYNTGTPIRAYVELYRLTKDVKALDQANRLAAAATDRTKALYDLTVRNPALRYWFDGGYFVHYLVDGLLQLYQASPGAKSERYWKEAQRNAEYAFEYLRDPKDGLFFRNFRLWTIGEEQCRRWQQLTGQMCHLKADDSERSKEPDQLKLPVEKRRLVKTLLGNAGIARLFWLIARTEA